MNDRDIIKPPERISVQIETEDEIRTWNFNKPCGVTANQTISYDGNIAEFVVEYLDHFDFTLRLKQKVDPTELMDML